MKVVSWNVNGLRSVYKKGFLDFLEMEKPDILCLQETRVQKSQLPADLLTIKSYQAYFSSAKKKGYGGVCVYSRVALGKINKKLDFE